VLKEQHNKSLKAIKHLEEEMTNARHELSKLQEEHNFYSTEDTDVVGTIIIPAILRANKTIHIIQYQLYETSIVEALCTVAGQKKAVTIILDSSLFEDQSKQQKQAQNRDNALAAARKLKNAGADVYKVSGMGLTKYRGVNHHKLLVIDLACAYGGSANYTYPVSNRQNRDHVAVFRKQHDIAKIMKVFKNCKKEATKV